MIDLVVAVGRKSGIEVKESMWGMVMACLGVRCSPIRALEGFRDY